MRYVVGFVLFLLALVASVRSASAQAGEEGETPEPNLEEPVSSPAPESEVPDIDALSQRAIEHYEIQSTQSRSKRRHASKTHNPRAALIASSVILVGGAAAMGGSFAVANKADDLSDLGPAAGLFLFGGAPAVGGIIGIGISGKRLSTTKRKHNELEQAHYGIRRRAQWDLTQSRLVF